MNFVGPGNYSVKLKHGVLMVDVIEHPYGMMIFTEMPKFSMRDRCCLEPQHNGLVSGYSEYVDIIAIMSRDEPYDKVNANVMEAMMRETRHLARNFIREMER